MNIDFEALKRIDIDKTTLVNIMSMMYSQIQSTNTNIKMNELCLLEKNENDSFKITLEQIPISINDILIYSEDGTKVVTPKYITEINGQDIIFYNKILSNVKKVFVTYKY